MGRLTGKRILVAGAGGNLGSAIARAYLDEGADLILTSLTNERIAALADEARAKGRRAMHLAADFTKEDDIDRLAEHAWSAFGGVDAVFLSSQPANPNMGDLLTTSDEDWRTWFQIFVWGPMRLLRHLAPKMMQAGGGAIITVTSSTGDDPEPGFDAYGLGKAGLWWLTQYMAKEWGAGAFAPMRCSPAWSRPPATQPSCKRSCANPATSSALRSAALASMRTASARRSFSLPTNPRSFRGKKSASMAAGSRM